MDKQEAEDIASRIASLVDEKLNEQMVELQALIHEAVETTARLERAKAELAMQASRMEG